MSLSSKAHIVYLNAKGYTTAITDLKYIGSVADDTERDNLGNLEVGNVVVVSNSAEANNSPAIYHWNGSVWQMMGSQDIVNSVISILNDRYTATEIDALLLGLGIYPPVANLTDLNAIPSPTEGFLCNVLDTGSGKTALYQYKNATWSQISYEDLVTNVNQLMTDVSYLLGLADQTKFWKAPLNTLGELNGLPSPLVGEMRVVQQGLGGNPTLYRYTTQWDVYEAIPSVALESELTGIAINGNLSNQIVFVQESKTLWWYSATATSWIKIGGDNTYTNLTPTPATVGGISAGSTFSNKTQQEMWDDLLYPYIGPDITNFSTSILNEETQGGKKYIENGNTISNIQFNFTAAPKSNPIVSLQYFVGGIEVLGEVVNISTNTVINKSVNVSYNSPNTALEVKIVAKDSVGTATEEKVFYYLEDKLFYFIDAVDYIDAGQTDTDISNLLNGKTSSEYDYQDSRVRSTDDPFNPINQYIYYIWEESLGDVIPPVKFIVNGLPNTAWEKRVFSYTNQAGYTTNYIVWRSQYLLSNSFNIKVQ